MADETTETTTDATPSPGLAGVGGTVEDIMAELGLEPETDAERNGTAEATPSAKPAAGDKEAETAQAKGDKSDDEKTDDDDSPEAAKADTAAAKEMAEWLAVRKRAGERKAARRAASASPATAAASATPAAAATTTATTPAAAAPAAKDSDIKTAVADIIAALGALDDDDGAATADASGIAKKAAREADLATIKERLGVVAKAAEDSADAKAKYGELEKEVRARLKEIEDSAFVERAAEETIERMEDKLPFLSKHRNASKLVVQFATDFLERKGKVAPLAFIAEKVESVLARRAQEKNGAQAPQKNGKPNGAPEKQHSSRKTVSSDLATPPSRRQGADQRTPKQVEADLWSALNLDPDA